jgi:hypothetical protein
MADPKEARNGADVGGGEPTQPASGAPNSLRPPTDESVRQEIIQDLIHTRETYFGGEQVFPYWEALYAVIVSGLAAAYFGKKPWEQILLCVFGIMLTVQWALVVARNYLYSAYRVERWKKLEAALERTTVLNSGGSLSIFSMLKEQDAYVRGASRSGWAKYPTWAIRRQFPRILVGFWAILLGISLVRFFG